MKCPDCDTTMKVAYRYEKARTREMQCPRCGLIWVVTDDEYVALTQSKVTKHE